MHNYSTNEHIIGTWIDGKPLYEKTVTSNITGTSCALDLDIADVDVINLVPKGSLAQSNLPLPYITGTDARNNIGGYFNIGVSTTYFQWEAGSGSSHVTNAILTVQYTKTTDTVNS